MKLLIAILSFLVMLCAQIPKNEGTECKDILKKADCLLLAKYGTCKTHAKRMKTMCPKTCNFCAFSRACKSKKCPYKHVCLIDDNETAYCKCVAKCSTFDQKTGPICAGNGKTYKTICSMKMDQCKEKKSIHIYHYGNCIDPDACEDFMPSLCADLARKKFCQTSPQLMQFYCPAKCRLCRQPAPQPSCFKSRYGCCWNKNKPAKGPNQKGCGACREKSFCKGFKELCSDYKNLGIMRHSCPKTCGYC